MRGGVDNSLSLSEFYSCRRPQWLRFRDNHDIRSSAIRKDRRPLADCAQSALAGRIWNISEAFLASAADSRPNAEAQFRNFTLRESTGRSKYRRRVKPCLFNGGRI